MTRNDTLLTGDMIKKYYDLNQRKKEIEQEMNHLKKIFNTYFDGEAGSGSKGEFSHNGFKLQRQIRKSEKFKDELTISRLEDLNMSDLIKVVKKPDDKKINAAVSLGLLKEEDLEECRITNYSAAITVRAVN
ncbi:hypothetical protein CIL05_00780 [Virgibacillus profundi]|uniref:Uncharacterized protein n=1 Tax=Virgibacillus profundi TaxID=2024555 RepID=A0A2A2IIY9_9BACI|nr:hypothetical protein [Virgibacillus profundi]PAV31224.1 hypothetical protein CIL05_00780 [Virgibacillus profundi]PXY55409.1 hypothetical protein CIT14_00785 [Virgibacillus profundi]